MKNTKYQNIINIMHQASMGKPHLWELNYEIEEMIKRELGELKFPIDVHTLAENLEIRQYEDDLNYGPEKRISYRFVNYMSYIPNFSDSKEISCECNVQEKLHIYSERYAIAYSIGSYFQAIDYSTYGEIALFPTKNFIVEQFATLLLLPITLTCKTLSTFLENKVSEYPILTEKWIKYLSERSMTSQYISISGYELTRCMLVYNKDKAQDLISKYPNIFDEE